MRLTLDGIGKKFYQRWVFRDIHQELAQGQSLALVGSNGSGKSTLLRIIAGQLKPNEGTARLYDDSQLIPVEERYRYLSWSAPYMELYEDLSLEAHLKQHFQFKSCLLEDPMQLISLLNLAPHRDKPLRVFSSGMMQRVKVGTALFTDTPLLLLDEPTSNMDEANAQHIMALIREYAANRMLVLASNMKREFSTAEYHIIL